MLVVKVVEHVKMVSRRWDLVSMDVRNSAVRILKAICTGVVDVKTT